MATIGCRSDGSVDTQRAIGDRRGEDHLLRGERRGAGLRQGSRSQRGDLLEHPRQPLRGHRVQYLRRFRAPRDHAPTVVRMPGRHHPRALPRMVGGHDTHGRQVGGGGRSVPCGAAWCRRGLPHLSHSRCPAATSARWPSTAWTGRTHQPLLRCSLCRQDHGHPIHDPRRPRRYALERPARRRAR